MRPSEAWESLVEIERSDRMAHLAHVRNRVDVELLETLWTKFDDMLEGQPLEVSVCEGSLRRVRTVRALGIFEFQVDLIEHTIESYAIERDGLRRSIFGHLGGLGLFRGAWWLRFACQYWAPEICDYDFVEDPFYRPNEIAIDTCRALFQRLMFDPRYTQFCDDFDQALGLPSTVSELLEDHIVLGRSVCMAVHVQEAWLLTERTRAALRAVMLVA